MKRLGKDQKIKIAVLIVIVAFIFIHSMIPTDLSSKESSWFLNWLRGIIGYDILGYESIRKVAHFVEYTGLGFQLYVVLESFDRVQLFACFCIGELTALTDETIQIFSLRGSSLKDVWLDSAGVLFGMMIIIFLMKLIKGKQKL